MIPYYQSYGEKHKETLILLHSGGMAGEEWQPQIQRLSQRFHLLIPDLPGHGKTPLPDNTLTLEKLSQATLAMMDDANIKKAHILGSSMGAATAMRLALNHSERIQKAIFYRMSYQKNEATHAQTKQMANPEYWRKFGLEKWLSKLHEPQGGKDAWQRVIQRVSEALDPKKGAHNYKPEDFRQIKNPVLLITGDRDPIAPLEDILALYQQIPQCGLWIIPYADHITASNTWRASAFAEEILRFIAK